MDCNSKDGGSIPSLTCEKALHPSFYLVPPSPPRVCASTPTFEHRASMTPPILLPPAQLEENLIKATEVAVLGVSRCSPLAHRIAARLDISVKLVFVTRTDVQAGLLWAIDSGTRSKLYQVMSGGPEKVILIESGCYRQDPVFREGLETVLDLLEEDGSESPCFVVEKD